jgi:hypothetical protein
MGINKLKSARSAKLHALDVLAKKLDRATIEDADDLLLFEELKSDLASRADQEAARCRARGGNPGALRSAPLQSDPAAPFQRPLFRE